jgi:NAD(P)-dependent dehydrogenase (short-subunit alcohol dehydrogenase family)
VSTLAPFSFPGSVACVTGAGSGIGRAIAKALAAQGVRVLVTDVDEKRCMTVGGEITDSGGTAVFQRTDVRRVEDFTAARDRCLAEFGRIDIVVNNVGAMVSGRPEAISPDEWQRLFDINVLGLVRSNNVFLPLLMKQRSGHVVNTASASAMLNYSFDRTPYGASKAAVLNLSENLYLYLRPYGVGVSCICPTGVLTNILEQLRVIGEPLTLRRPDHEIVDAQTVADRTVKAIADRRFLVTSVDSAADEAKRKWTDIDAYLAEREVWLNTEEQ